MLTDEQTLLQKARNGDAQAWAQLTAPFQEKLPAFCRRFFPEARDTEDAGDAAVETFLRAWRYLHTFDGKCHFSTWLYKVATNVCRDILTQQGRLRTESLDAPQYAVVSQQAAGTPSTEQIVEWREIRRAIQVRGQSVKPPWDAEDRIIYWRHCENGESFSEIAVRLHWGESAVKQRYYRRIKPVLDQVEKEFRAGR